MGCSGTKNFAHKTFKTDTRIRENMFGITELIRF